MESCWPTLGKIDARAGSGAAGLRHGVTNTLHQGVQAKRLYQHVGDIQPTDADIKHGPIVRGGQNQDSIRAKCTKVRQNAVGIAQAHIPQ